MECENNFSVLNIQTSNLMELSQLPDQLYFQPPPLHISKALLTRLCQKENYSLVFFDSDSKTVTGLSGNDIPELNSISIEGTSVDPIQLNDFRSLEDSDPGGKAITMGPIDIDESKIKCIPDIPRMTQEISLSSPLQPMEFTLDEIQLAIGGSNDHRPLSRQPVVLQTNYDESLPLLEIFVDNGGKNDRQIISNRCSVERTPPQSNSSLIETVMDCEISNFESHLICSAQKDELPNGSDSKSDGISFDHYPSLKLVQSFPPNNTIPVHASLHDLKKEDSPNQETTDKLECHDNMDCHNFSDLIIIGSPMPISCTVDDQPSNANFGNSTKSTGEITDAVELNQGVRPECEEFAEALLQPPTSKSSKKSTKTRSQRSKGPEKFPYVCRTCENRRFKLRAYLINHELTHLDNPFEVFECKEPKCTAVYTTKAALTTHFNRNHRPDSIKNSTCPNCGDILTNPSYLHNKHLKQCNPVMYKEREALRKTSKPPPGVPKMRNQRKKPAKGKASQNECRFKCSHPGCKYGVCSTRRYTQNHSS